MTIGAPMGVPTCHRNGYNASKDEERRNPLAGKLLLRELLQN